MLLSSVRNKRALLWCGLVKLPGSKTDVLKKRLRGAFSHFYPCRAEVRLRYQKQKFIRAAVIFGACSFKRADFCAGKE